MVATVGGGWGEVMLLLAIARGQDAATCLTLLRTFPPQPKITSSRVSSAKVENLGVEEFLSHSHLERV